ncbi:MAG: hypothetical protein AAGK74_18020, partial [Chloroflexota bacterium]
NLRLIVVLMLLGALACPVTWLMVIFAIDRVAAERVESTFRVHPGAEYLWEDMAHWGADTGNRKVFYVSEDSVERVRTHYEQFYPEFESETYGNHDWLQTGHRIDNGEAVNCGWNYAYENGRYNCVRVFLLESGTPDIMGAWPMADGEFARQSLPEQFDDLPDNGTLIIYEYWIALESQPRDEP